MVMEKRNMLYNIETFDSKDNMFVNEIHCNIRFQLCKSAL